MRVHIADHPLIAHKLTALRDKNTDTPTFRRLADELVTLLAYEATRGVRVEPAQVDTPVARATGVRLARPVPLVVPVLRAGLGMLDGMTRLLPTAEVGFLGMVRNETTLEATTYANRLPYDLSGRQCYLLDQSRHLGCESEELQHAGAVLAGERQAQRRCGRVDIHFDLLWRHGIEVIVGLLAERSRGSISSSQ